MYNLCKNVPLFNEYIYRNNNSIPHDINQVQHTIRKKKHENYNEFYYY